MRAGSPRSRPRSPSRAVRAGRAIAPAGTSKGRIEAGELRDGGSRLGGLDVRRAVAHVQGEIAKALLGRDAMDQDGIDRLLAALDGTPDKRRLGANAIVAVSLANLHAAGGGTRAAALCLSPRRGRGDPAPAPGADLRRRCPGTATRRRARFHGDGDRGCLLRSGTRVERGSLPCRRKRHERVGPGPGGGRRRRAVAGLRFRTRRRSKPS